MSENVQVELMEDLVKQENPVLEVVKVLLKECAASKDPSLIEATTKFMEVSAKYDFI
ncbi:hypothetical protein [Macrococcus brunensis]|uniref:hypothetical protein n=1 Tax=Macrococcus brunensis TaxID=198483 RepID=UPI001EF048AC|nr:hypothetical protein [Macrococcus brunensis]ULG72977.1 hypothetical protein MGG12_05530 [Macrococcus brunensis]